MATKPPDEAAMLVDQREEESADANAEREQRIRGAISRRGFLQGLAATGAAVAFFSSSVGRAQRNLFRTVDLSDDELLELYDRMLEVRWFDRTLADLTARGETRGYTGHFYPGQDAVAVGASFALNDDDYVLSTHRPHGHGLAKGVDMNALAAEIFLKSSGLNGGYGGTMHFADPSVGFLGADGIVGPGASFGTGVAHALKVRGRGQVALVYGGDGHFGSPHFHSSITEAVNAGSPYIYMLENNQYLQYAHYGMVSPVEDYATVARAAGMRSVVVDGQDVLAVFDATREAVDRARDDGGPTFIEAKTYRYYNHSGASGVEPGEMGAFGPDPLLINMTQRPDREVRAWMAKDPIDIYRRTLTEFELLDEDESERRVAAAREKVDEAFRLAQEAPVPTAEDGLRNVFADTTLPARHVVDR